jgi:hypothetical protein
MLTIFATFATEENGGVLWALVVTFLWMTLEISAARGLASFRGRHRWGGGFDGIHG